MFKMTIAIVKLVETLAIDIFMTLHTYQHIQNSGMGEVFFYYIFFYFFIKL